MASLFIIFDKLFVRFEPNIAGVYGKQTYQD